MSHHQAQILLVRRSRQGLALRSMERDEKNASVASFSSDPVRGGHQSPPGPQVSRKRVALVLGIGFIICVSGVRASATGETHDENQQKLDQMLQGNCLSNDNVRVIQYLLEEQTSMIDLFRNSGHLPEIELQRKIREITEVTWSSIHAVLTPAEKLQWDSFEVRTVRQVWRSWKPFLLQQRAAKLAGGPKEKAN